ERVAVLERIESELKQQRGEAKNLVRNEERLGKLVEQLAVAIAEEEEADRKRAEEARRLAEERRKAEERRLAEERRKAEAKSRAEQEKLTEERRRRSEERRVGREGRTSVRA